MKKLFFFASLVLLCACNKTPSKQSLPLNRDEFKANLKAVHLFEAGLANSIYSKDTLNPKLLQEYDSLFASRNTTKEAFLTTYNAYYDYYTDDFDSLYNEIEQEFTSIRDSLERNRSVQKKMELKDVANKQLLDEQVQEEKLELNPEHRKSILSKKREMHPYDD